MLDGQPHGTVRCVTSTIICHAPAARDVRLTGSFNNWNPTALPMVKNDAGEWIADLELPPGRYEYKFVVDGVPCCEPHLKNGHPECEQCAPHPCGDLNRILLVR